MFSIRYKFLIALLGIVLFSLGVFFFFAYRTFSEDKKLFVTDLNLTVLKAVSSELKSEFENKLFELQALIPLIHEKNILQNKGENPFIFLTQSFRKEIFNITFYKDDFGILTPVKNFINYETLFQKKIPISAIYEVERIYPIKTKKFVASKQIEWMNRSIFFSENERKRPLTVLTILIKAKTIGILGGSYIVSVDIDQKWLFRKLKKSEVAEMFLLKKDGTLLSHSNQDQTIAFSGDKVFNHPVFSKISEEKELLPVESSEIKIGGEAYICSYSQLEFKDIYLVSQIKKALAFSALTVLVKQFVWLALFVLCLTVLVAVLLAGKLTSNIRQLKIAAEKIGSGDLNVALNIKTKDEINNVSEAIKEMAKRISILLLESEERARLKGELQTAQLVQSTFINCSNINNEIVELESYYLPATECGGDFFDASIKDNKLFALIADATGHGAPAALLTAVAKSFFSTIERFEISGRLTLPLEEKVSLLNSVVYHTCHGKLLLTACFIELDMVSGQLKVVNAGHEPPIRIINKEFKTVRRSRVAQRSIKGKFDVLYAYGERIGFDIKSSYSAYEFSLNKKDIVVLYTDGITEVQNHEGKHFGERNLKSLIIQNLKQPLPDISLKVSDAILNHLGKEPQKDDITFLLIRWKGAETEKLAA